jgi:dihydropteroate synthase
MTTAAEATSTADANTLDRLVRHLADPTVLVCGIVNATPDSFFDGGRYQGPSRAVDHAHTLIIEGADMLDVGGESTRPGSHPPSVAEEIARVIPVIETLARKGMLGAITGRDVTQRRAASVAAAMIAARHGASILRVHDVAATVDAVAVMRAVDTARATAPRSPQLM